MQNTPKVLLPSQFITVSESETHGVYEIEGLAPGYGHTLGNSLRRIILSSLEGVAITLIKIKGADHEYATLDGVVEDTLQILLSLKKVHFQMLVDEPQVMELKVHGPKVVTAADFAANGAVEVVNKDQYICEITGKQEFEMEVHVSKGMGFVSRDRLHTEKIPVGSLALDAVFSPIRKVSYQVEDMRVGDRTDHNRLRLNIETTGSISPKEALQQSIYIMLAQLRAVVNLHEEEEKLLVAEVFPPEEEVQEEEEQIDESVLNDILKTRIDQIDMPSRIENALLQANIRTIGGLVQKTESDLLNLDGIGAKGLDDIKRILGQYGVGLKEE